MEYRLRLCCYDGVDRNDDEIVRVSFVAQHHMIEELANLWRAVVDAQMQCRMTLNGNLLAIAQLSLLCGNCCGGIVMNKSDLEPLFVCSVSFRFV